MFSRDVYEHNLYVHSSTARKYIADVCGEYLEELDPGWTQGIEPSELTWFDEAWALDGMDPLEWCEAMTME